MMRLICQSRTYQLALETNKWNADDKVNYSHAKARRLSAEALFDAVFAVTGSTASIPGIAAGTRAAQLADSQTKLPDGFLGNFGRPVRESVCECERSNDINLGPVMALMSGPTVGDAISDPKNAIAKLATEIKDDRQLINEIFMRILNRNATPKEIEAALASMNSMPAENKTLGAELTISEAKNASVILAAEKDRLAKITAAKTTLDTFNKAQAPIIAKAEAVKKAKAAAATKTIANVITASPNFQKQWENYTDLSTVWQPLDIKVIAAAGVTTLEVQPDKSLLAKALPEGRTTSGNYQLSAMTKLTNITGIKLEVLPHASLPNGGPGLAPDGNFVLGEFTVTATPSGNKPPRGQTAKKGALDLKNPTADFEQNTFSIAEALKKGQRDKGWGISPEGGYRHEATFEFAQPIGEATGTTLTFVMNQTFQNGKYNLGHFRLWVTTSPTVRFGTSQAVATALKQPAMARSKPLQADLASAFQAQYRTLQTEQRILFAAQQPLPIDPQLTALTKAHEEAQKPIMLDPKLVQLRRDAGLSQSQLINPRMTAAQDLAWALINSPAFLFNH
jgi:hypothetical protein